MTLKEYIDVLLSLDQATLDKELYAFSPQTKEVVKPIVSLGVVVDGPSGVGVRIEVTVSGGGMG
jgi:hypothetical protein